MNKGSFFMGCVMLAIFATMVGIAMQYPPQARFMPLVVGIPGIVLCLVQLGLEWRRRPVADRGMGMRADVESIPHEAAPLVGVVPAPGAAWRELILWAAFIALVASLVLFGFWLTIPVFLALFLRFYGHESWRFSLMLSVIATALLYLVFAKVLGVTLHGGFFTDYALDLVRGGWPRS